MIFQKKNKMNLNFNIWEGKFKDFAESKQKFSTSNFEVKHYQKKLTQDFNLSYKNFLKKKLIGVNLTSRSVNLPFLVSTLNKKNKIKILDFGGGLGISYLYLLQCLPHLKSKIEYTIIELNEICEIGKKNNLNINFLKEIPKKKFDIIFSSSAIQYTEKWKKTLYQLTNLKSKYILLSDVFLTKNPSFVTLQNYYSTKIPQWFFNEKIFMQIFKKNYYKLIFKDIVRAKRLDFENILPMKNFNLKYRIKHTLHLLFINDKF